MNPNGVTEMDTARIVGNPGGVRNDVRSVTQGALAKPRDPGLRSVTPIGVQDTVKSLWPRRVFRLEGLLVPMTPDPDLLPWHFFFTLVESTSLSLQFSLRP